MSDVKCPCCDQEMTPKQAEQHLKEHFPDGEPTGVRAQLALEHYELLKEAAKKGG